MKKIIVASKNPVKITATQAAFEKMFPSEKYSIEGVPVSSGVSDQPTTDSETAILFALIPFKNVELYK